jgi:hypothetical protein
MLSSVMDHPSLEISCLMFKPIKSLRGMTAGGLGSEGGRLKRGIWGRGFQSQTYLTQQMMRDFFHISGWLRPSSLG